MATKTTKAKAKPEAAEVEVTEVAEVVEVQTAPAQVAPDFTVKDLAKKAQAIKAAYKAGKDVSEQVKALIDQHKVLLRFNGLTDEDRRFVQNHMKVLLPLV